MKFVLSFTYIDMPSSVVVPRTNSTGFKHALSYIMEVGTKSPQTMTACCIFNVNIALVGFNGVI